MTSCTVASKKNELGRLHLRLQKLVRHGKSPRSNALAQRRWQTIYSATRGESLGPNSRRNKPFVSSPIS